FANRDSNTRSRSQSEKSDGPMLYLLQSIYILGASCLIPMAPFLLLQAKWTRKKVGVIPPAAGDVRGRTSGDGPLRKLLVIGESTVAGLGARTHKEALSGQFARFLSQLLSTPVEWYAIGKNGVTARQTLRELVPQIPQEHFDFILLGVGGNDVLKLTSPVGWRRTMNELLTEMRRRYPNSTIFMTNAPAVHLSPILPQPIKLILGSLSKMHDLNAKEFTQNWKQVFYFHRPDEVPADFFADGIHPSENGYELWSHRMVEFFSKHQEWSPHKAEPH
ncbi:MAG: SGNH/GDSL hydrolase family protein, partial [Acidobacteriota bacterium]